MIFTHVFGYPGETSTLPLLAFIFLVTLGVDYNIFLMARTREERLATALAAGCCGAWP